MTVKAGYSTPFLQVTDVERSIRFYAQLGFELVDVEGPPGSTGWARVHCEGGAIMFSRSDDSTAPDAERFLLYLYTPDLPGLSAQLTAAGVEVSPIIYPDHMLSGEMSLKDPDGYSIFIGHWSEWENEAWKRQCDQKRAAGRIP
jgi:catechol 2,3-dioxygenase-like lactoylglutathione lyase family enzyme